MIGTGDDDAVPHSALSGYIWKWLGCGWVVSSRGRERRTRGLALVVVRARRQGGTSILLRII